MYINSAMVCDVTMALYLRSKLTTMQTGKRLKDMISKGDDIKISFAILWGTSSSSSS